MKRKKRKVLLMGGPGGRGPSVPKPPGGGVTGARQAAFAAIRNPLRGAPEARRAVGRGSDCKSATSPLLNNRRTHVGRQALSLSALLLLAVSCSDTRGKLKIIEGSFFNSQGMYTEAIVAYRDSLSFTAAAPYGEYGLGVMYLSLEEEEAALVRFAAAEQALTALDGEEHHELRYRIHYNRGVIRFRNEDYAGAAEEFRKALEADSSHIEAKRNLELSLLSANRQGSASPVPLAAGDGRGEGTREDVLRNVLFDYLRRKEQDRWRSREWVEDTSVSGPDY